MANKDWYFIIPEGPLFFRITSLFFSLELDEDLLSSERELMPLNELRYSDEEVSGSSAFSTTTTTNSGPSIFTSTNISTEGMSSIEPIPCLSIGPYHQRPTPILTDSTFAGSHIVDCYKVLPLWKDIIYYNPVIWNQLPLRCILIDLDTDRHPYLNFTLNSPVVHQPLTLLCDTCFTSHISP
ncbi:hypothetical protein LOAG_01033 [Loa loa]|uniref:Uncharacterized protein n=1 Tax=Loa loa TaxID=7209 RepID=A0A1S0UAE8_LOALO|nr:hypothetical protein LOAG_01033 [Loa loa]EFO27443.1 hypothetical protein LOAG_01033 [Loa loa]